MRISDIHTAYFVGIGGIGMSALARYFKREGMTVSGYDRTRTELTEQLEREGIAVHYEPRPDLLPKAIDLAVFTPAVPDRQAELVELRRRGVALKKRAEVLGMISRSRDTIAVAGTHGKTTTSSLLTWLLHQGGLSCTAFLGGIALDFDSNYVPGDSAWVVAEADEYDRSFLHLHPKIALILSIEPDHLDIYGDAEQILETGFRAFARGLRADGSLWVHESCREALRAERPVQTFGLEAGDARATRIRVEDGAFQFDYQVGGAIWRDLRLSLPGRHNVENAVAAISVARQLGLEEAQVRPALASFGGIRRRFERLFDDGQRVYIDDYAHHPSELRAAIGAARELYPDRRLTGVFQPHLYSRTRDFAAGFAEALRGLDQLILMDIYPAREAPIPGVDADMLLPGLHDTPVLRVSAEQVMDVLQELDIEVLLTLGAGDIDRLRMPIRQWLMTQSTNPQTTSL